MLDPQPPNESFEEQWPDPEFPNVDHGWDVEDWEFDDYVSYDEEDE